MDTKQLNKFVKEGVDALIQKKGAEDLIASVAETAEEKLDISKADFKKIVAHAYEKQYNPEKYQEKRIKINELYGIMDEVV